MEDKITPVCNPGIAGLACGEGSYTASFAKFISAFVGFIIIIATLWSFFQMLRGGIEWITSGGDKGKVMEARERIMQAIIGLIIVVASWSLYILVLKFLGLTSGDGVNFILPKFF